MSEAFDYDVFISHSSKDKGTVRVLAERLRGDGLRVWLDEWVIRPGDSIPLALSRGLEKSCVLIVMWSANFFASEWTTFEHNSFLFRDPNNRQRRFVPLRLDNCDLPLTLRQFLWLDWHTPDDDVYRKLFDVCRRSVEGDTGGSDGRPNTDDVDPRSPDVSQRGPDASPRSVDTSPTTSDASLMTDDAHPGTDDASILDDNRNPESVDASPIASEPSPMPSDGGKKNEKVRQTLFREDNQDSDVENGSLIGSIIFEGHTGSVSSVCLSKDNRFIASGGWDKTVRLWDIASEKCVAVFEGHTDNVASVAFSDEGRFIVSGSGDCTVRVWDISAKRCLATLDGHSDHVYSVACSADGVLIASGSRDNTIRLWDIASKLCIAVLKGHTDRVFSVAFSNDGQLIASGAWDKTVRLWNVTDRKCIAVLSGHTDSIWSVAFSGDGRFIASGSRDDTIRLWNVAARQCTDVLVGHRSSIRSVAFSGDGRFVASGSRDATVRLWDVATKQCVITLEEHTDIIWAVAFGGDGRFMVSGSGDKTVRLWDVAALGLRDNTVMASGPSVYVNARVLLVGDSGVGKSGLAHRLTNDDYKETDSTDGAWATIVPLPNEDAKDGKADDGPQREVWLWDFAGQQDYRLLHQLFMDDAALAIHVFNPQHDNPFEGLGRWDWEIRKAAGGEYAKLLVAGRIDRGGAVISANRIEKFVAERGFKDYIETSALTGKGCDTLLAAIRRHIDWNRLTRTVSPRIFRRLKEEIIGLRDSGVVLLRREELRQRLEFALSDDPFTAAQFDTVVGLLTGPGIVWKLDFGDFILLRPEEISAYCGAVVRKVRRHEDETGCISEEDFITGNLDYQDRPRLPRHEEEIVLRALLQTLLQRGICFKESTDRGNMLIFPSLFRVERPDLTVHPPLFVTYRFAGMLEDIYATLVVRLHHTHILDKDALWRNAADFTTNSNQRVGVKAARLYEGNNELTVYCDPAISIADRVAFMRYIDGHIRARATEVTRSRHYVCPNCETSAENVTAIAKLLERGDSEMICIVCRQEFPLRDEIERRFGLVEARRTVAKMNAEADIALDTQSKEQILVGEVGAIAGKAGQVFRPTPNADYGIDGEIEFKTAQNHATGKRVYVQLKSGDSYLRLRKTDNVEVFDIPDDRHIDYWQSQPCDVWLVIRNADGRVRWMNITDALKSQPKRSRQVIFVAEDFTPTNLLTLRDRLIVSA